MADDLPAGEGTVCERCMTPNDPGDKACIRCGAPLGDFGSTAPWEFGKARPKAYHEPTSPRKRPIILVAVWVLFGGPAIYGGSALYELVQKILARDPVTASTGEAIMAVLVVLYLLASAWVLWVVTRGYFRRGR
jgi:hypothetical protein